MKLFFAGAENPIHRKSLRECGVSRFLFTYYTAKDAPYFDDEEVLCDSGGYTARIKGETLDVSKYAEFLNEFKIKWAFEMDMDDMEVTLKNRAYLKKHARGTYIIPIYHMSSWLDPKYKGMLDQMIKEYPFISVGGIAGVTNSAGTMQKFLDYVFYRTRDKVKVHGLGMTSRRMMERYPWYSVDSTTWLCFQRFGSSQFIKDERVEKAMTKQMHYNRRNAHEIKQWLKYEEYVTKLWKKRGIQWT